MTYKKHIFTLLFLVASLSSIHSYATNILIETPEPLKAKMGSHLVISIDGVIHDGPETKALKAVHEDGIPVRANSLLFRADGEGFIVNGSTILRTMTPEEKRQMARSISAFGVVAHVRQNAIGILKDLGEVAFTALNGLVNMGQVQIKVLAACDEDGCSINASYDPRVGPAGTIILPHFDDGFGNFKSTAEIFTVVAHEAGHMVLDKMFPHLLSGGLFARALHESFGDLSAVFSCLSLKSSSDLASTLPSLDEGFCIGCHMDKATDGYRCIRKAGDTGDVSCKSEHSMSEPLTTLVVQSMVSIFNGSDFSAEICLKGTHRLFFRSIIAGQSNANPLMATAKYFVRNAPRGYGIGGILFPAFQNSIDSCVS